MEYKIRCFECKKEFILKVQPQVFNRTYRHFCKATCFNKFLSERMKLNNPMKNEIHSKKQSESLIKTYNETDLRERLSLSVKQTFANGRINYNKGKYWSSLEDIETYHYLVRSNIWRITRLQILERDDYTCQRCGEVGNCIDHIIPWRIGKDSSNKNLQVLCKHCNSKKVSEDKRKWG